MLFRNVFYLLNNMTPAERALEPYIAALGTRYRSQWLFARLRYIADFVLLDSRVIIEVDDRSHEEPEKRRKDLTRMLVLESEGWKVIRVTNAEALKDPGGVINSLASRLAGRLSLEALREALAELPPPSEKKKRSPTRTPKQTQSPLVVPDSRAPRPPSAGRRSKEPSRGYRK